MKYFKQTRQYRDCFHLFIYCAHLLLVNILLYFFLTCALKNRCFKGRRHCKALFVNFPNPFPFLAPEVTAVLTVTYACL